MRIYKPPNHNSLSPYLIVENAEAALQFIRQVFGSEPRLIVRAHDGSISHAEVIIDDTVLMLGQMPGGSPAHVHVYLADVDASFAAARTAGGTVIQEVMEKGDGDRRGGITDPSGTTWWLATHKASDTV